MIHIHPSPSKPVYTSRQLGPALAFETLMESTKTPKNIALIHHPQNQNDVDSIKELKKAGYIVIVDTDDPIWDLPKYTPKDIVDQWQAALPFYTEAVQLAHILTFSTPELADEFRTLFPDLKNTFYLPCVPCEHLRPSLPTLRGVFKELTVVIRGSYGFDKLLELNKHHIDRMRETCDVLIIGSDMYEPALPYDEYFDWLKDVQPDVIVRLNDTESYNRNVRSNHALLEAFSVNAWFAEVHPECDLENSMPLNAVALNRQILLGSHVSFQSMSPYLQIFHHFHHINQLQHVV